MLINCSHCGQQANRNTGEVNRNIRLGHGTYCSQECSGKAKRKQDKSPGWHALRFHPDSSKVEVPCLECGRRMWLPPSKADEYRRCSPSCQVVGRQRERESRKRPCQTCGKIIYPRPQQIARGGGKFCSQKCNTAVKDFLNTPEQKAITGEKLRALHAAGLMPKPPSGPDNPQWRGGRAGYNKRMTESGKMAEKVREYRKRNPHKVREFKQRRSNLKGKGAKLPRGTIAKIGELQRWKCAICRDSIKHKYHADHITPIKRGGQHIPANIQLLCPRCNVRKSSRDPIDYMQSIGRLL